MNLPFPITDAIRAAYHAHADYVSAGDSWLQHNDPRAEQEDALIRQIQTAVRRAAHAHFGRDEQAEWEFLHEFGVDDTQGVWFEIIDEIIAAEAQA